MNGWVMPAPAPWAKMKHVRAVLKSLALAHKFTIWRTEESRNRSSEILIAISIAALAARSYRSLSYLLLLSGRSAEPPTFSALSAAERQISRILCAASISPIGHSIFSSQTSLRLPLLNHLIAVPLSKSASIVGRRTIWAGVSYGPLARRQDLSGIENILRIQRLLQRAHGVDGLGAEFGPEVFLLALPDAVFAGAGPAHRLGALHQAMHEVLAARHFVTIVDIAQQRAVEIAVTDMTDNRRHQVEALQVRFGLGHAIGQPRNRHAHVGRHHA